MNSTTYPMIRSKFLLAVTLLTLVMLTAGCGNSTPQTTSNSNLIDHEGYTRLLPMSGPVVYFTQGEHAWDDNPNGIFSSIDIAPKEVRNFSPGERVTVDSQDAIAPVSGTIIAMGNERDRNDPLHSIIKIREDETELIFEIMHIDKFPNTISVGSKINAGDIIGKPSSEVPKGGQSTGVHLHLTLRDKNDKPIPIKGYEFSGWAVNGNTMKKQGEEARVANLGRVNSGLSRNDLTQDVKPIPALSPKPLVDPRIAFISKNDAHGDSLYVMNGDGTNRVLLANTESLGFKFIFGLSWSPDARRIAFGVASTEYGQRRIAVAQADGSGSHVLGNEPGDYWDQDMSWSPDSQKITFYSSRNMKGDIYVMNADGSKVTLLTRNGSHPEWSPDGKRIGFVSTLLGNTELYTISSDGANLKQVTTDLSARQGLSFSWSHNGEWIALELDREGSQEQKQFQYPPSEIYVVNVGNGSLHRLTTTADNLNLEAASFNFGWRSPWSPNDEKLLFYAQSLSGSPWDIYTINRDGTRFMKLTNIPSHQNGLPSWSPDGKRIAFSSSPYFDPNGIHPDVYVMNADGSDLHRLTNSDGNMPTWSPR